MSKEITAEQVREQVLSHLRHLASYWSSLQDKTPKERCEGMVFSMLTMIDGCSGLPSFDLVVRPHPDDKQFHIDEGEDYYADGQVINRDVHLHDLFFK